MKAPKPLSKDDLKSIETIRLLAGEKLCAKCKGSGKGWTKELDIDGRKYHFTTTCSHCYGKGWEERYDS